MARSFFSALRTLWYIFCTSIVAACAFTVFRWLNNTSIVVRSIIIDFFSAFGLVFLFLCSICLIRIMLRNRKAVKLSSAALENGYTEEYFAYFERRVDRAKRSDKKGAAQISLASCYAEAARYDDAFEVLRAIDFAALSEHARAAYYNTAVYTSLMSGDLEEAERQYISGKSLLDKYSLGSLGAEIMHTVAALEYARGDLYRSESILLDVRDYTHSDSIVSGCNIYLIMIYLATDRLEQAKLTAEMTFPIITTYRDKQTLLRLMHCIESAYGITGNNHKSSPDDGSITEITERNNA